MTFSFSLISVSVFWYPRYFESFILLSFIVIIGFLVAGSIIGERLGTLGIPQFISKGYSKDRLLTEFKKQYRRILVTTMIANLPFVALNLVACIKDGYYLETLGIAFVGLAYLVSERAFINNILLTNRGKHNKNEWSSRGFNIFTSMIIWGNYFLDIPKLLGISLELYRFVLLVIVISIGVYYIFISGPKAYRKFISADVA